MSNVYKSLFHQNFLALLLFYSISFLALHLVETQILITEEHYIETLSKNLDIERIEGFLAQRKKTVVFEALFFLIEKWATFFGLTFLLYISVFAFDIKISFGDFLKIALIAHYVFIVLYLFKVLWFLFINHNFTLDQYSEFVPLSIANLINTDSIDELIRYPLKFINVFDALFSLILGYGIFFLNYKSFKFSMTWAVMSYTIITILWIIIVTFLKISL